MSKKVVCAPFPLRAKTVREQFIPYIRRYDVVNSLEYVYLHNPDIALMYDIHGMYDLLGINEFMTFIRFIRNQQFSYVLIPSAHILETHAHIYGQHETVTFLRDLMDK